MSASAINVTRIAIVKARFITCLTNKLFIIMKKNVLVLLMVVSSSVVISKLKATEFKKWLEGD